MVNHQNRAGSRLCFSLFLFLCLALAACGKNELAEVAVSGKTMGTWYNVKVVGQKETLPAPEQLQGWADALFAEINQSMSTYIDDSELSRLNQTQSSDWQTISPRLFEVLKVSEQISALSGGAFDITVAPLVNLWGFGPGKHDYNLPADEAIEALRSHIGYHQVELQSEPQQLRKPAGLTMDLSAVAKGFAADELARELEARGFANVLVEVGGELALRGHSVRGGKWKIGVESPDYAVLGANPGNAKVVALSDEGMATSGDYRNYYELEGKRYSHTIDPRTGRPITHKLASVTVVAETCAEADALATALNVLGSEAGMALAEEQKIAAMFIVNTEDGFKTLQSEAFKPYLGE